MSVPVLLLLDMGAALSNVMKYSPIGRKIYGSIVKILLTALRFSMGTAHRDGIHI